MDRHDVLPSQRDLFDIPEDVCYLNCAYMSPLMKPVVEAGQRSLDALSRPWEVSAPDFFTDTEVARARFGALIGASAEGVAIVPSCSYGMGLAARNLPLSRGQRIVTVAEQFPSNVYVWRELARERGGAVVAIGRGEDGGFDTGLLEAIDANTAIVALPHCHWTDGTLIDLVSVGARCREVGAALVVDVAQSCGALPFDVAEVQPDFVVAVTYKWLMGPYALGFVYVAPEWREGSPLEQGWMARLGAENFAGLVDYEERFRAGARRYDMGQVANFHVLPLANAAMAQLAQWGVANIQATLRALTGGLAEGALALGLELPAPHLRAGHLVGLGFPRGMPESLLQTLSERKIFVSRRGDTLRVGPHLYNDEGDVGRLLEALDEAVG